MLTHRYVHRVDPRILGLIALCGFSIGSFWVSSYNKDASFAELLWPQILVGTFLGGLFPPLAAIGLSGLRKSAEMRGTAFLNLLRVSGQAMGIPVAAALWDRRRILHRHFLGEGNAMTREQSSSAYHVLQANGIGAPVSHGLLTSAIAHQAALLAFNEIFYIAGWAFWLWACSSSWLGRFCLPSRTRGYGWPWKSWWSPDGQYYLDHGPDPALSACARSRSISPVAKWPKERNSAAPWPDTRVIPALSPGHGRRRHGGSPLEAPYSMR